MAYGYYSEVYFAVDLNNYKRIKIGETTNARRRNAQLDVYITQCIEVGGNHTYRLLIESLLREKIARMPKVTQAGTDYFICEDTDTVNFIQNEFENWVKHFQKSIEKVLTDKE